MHRFPLAFIATGLLLAGCTAEHVRQPQQAVDTDSEIAVRIDRYLSGLEGLGFSGAIIVDEGGQVVLRKGYGLADRETRRPYAANTVQTHGSITKQMTAAAILLLESRGALSVEDSLDRHFNNTPEDKRDITLHQLLTHSSGLPGSVGRDNEAIGTTEFVERVMDTPLQFDPGTDYSYSNVGYSLLGIIIERQSGQGYETYLREELLLPAGLAESGYLLPDWNPDRLAVGYRQGEHWGKVHGRGWRDDGPGWHLRANGGLHTTVDDMHRWLDTLRGEGVLAAEAVRRWTTGYVDEGGDSKYAYGWAVHDTEEGIMIAHNGGNGIFSADFVWFPDADLFFYIQGNTSVIAASRLRDSLLAAAFDPDITMPPLVESYDDASAEEAEAKTGSYEIDGGSVELVADDTRLIARLSGQGALDLALQHTPEQQEYFNRLNQRTMRAMEKLQAGRADAFEGLVDNETDPAERSRSMLDFIERTGELRSLTLVGSIANAPGARFADLTPWTTFVRADFGQRIQMWGVLWKEDNTYRGTAIGPLSDVPSFILIPTAKNHYTGIRRNPPWTTTEFHIDETLTVRPKSPDH